MKTLLIILTILVCACHERNQTITDSRDYNRYLSNAINTSVNPLNEEIKFWSDRLDRNSKDEVAMIKLAGLSAGHFKISGEISELELSDSLYHSILKIKQAGSVEIYQCLGS
jgi:hypothetical protein